MKILTKLKENLYKRYLRFLSITILVASMTTPLCMSAIPTLDILSLEDFVILAGSTITGIPTVSITGNVGLSPAAGSNIVGFDGSNVNGILYVVDATGPAGSVINASLLTTAKGDLTTAYNDAAGRTPVPTGSFLNPGSGNIGGLNLVPGLYKFTSQCQITGSNLTLTGSATDVWIFQIASILNLGSGIHIILAGGAQASNIFWQVGTSATIGTYAVFKGTILADQSISFDTGASLDGRALAFTGAVTMGSGVTPNISVSKPIFSSDSTQVRFGNVAVSSSKRDSVVITNTGGADLIIDSLKSSNGLFTFTPSNGTITPGSTRKFYFTFAPTSDSLKDGYIYFYHNGSPSKDSIRVSGNGVSPVFSVIPNNLNFGNVRNGQTKMDSVIVSNTGTVNLVISTITSSNSVFHVSLNNVTLTPGSSRTVYISFSPIVKGDQNGFIYFNHNAKNRKDSVSVRGTGVSPTFSSNPKSLNFGTVEIGTSKTDSVTVTNIGTDILIISLVASSNFNFTVAPTYATINPGQTRKFYITFTPQTDGLKEGNIYFYHNDTKAIDTVIVTGRGVSPQFNVDPRSLSFGLVNTADTKIDSVTIYNNGTSDLIITNIETTNYHFTTLRKSLTIAPEMSEVLYITFTPLTAGNHTGYIRFTFNATNKKDSISVAGVGVGDDVSPGFTVSPIALNFGNVESGTSKVDSVTVTNTGIANLTIFGISSTNVFYTINPNIAIIASGASKKFYVTFAPLIPGMQQGKVIFNHNAPSLQDSISVTGTGTGNDIAPIFSVYPASLDFGTVFIGNSKQRSVRVTNLGNSNLIISNVVSNDYHFSVNPIFTIIQPGTSHEYFITFEPTEVNAVNSYIRFTHNAGINDLNVVGRGVGYVNVITIKEARELPIGDIFAIEGVVTRSLGNYTRIQDETGAIAIYQESGLFFDDVQSNEVQMTDRIRVQGRISEQDNLKVISNTDLVGFQRLSRLNALPVPFIVTLEEIANNGEQYESCLINVNKLLITSDNDVTYQQSTSYQITDPSDYSNRVVVRIGKSPDTDMDGMWLLGPTVSYSGVLSQASTTDPLGGYQLTPVLATDIRFNTDVSDPTTTMLYSLYNNYPNPFNTSTTIEYKLEKAGFVSLKVLNLLGNEVATLVKSYQDAGVHSVLFSSDDYNSSLANSVYFYRLEVGTFVSTKPMILSK